MSPVEFARLASATAALTLVAGCSLFGPSRDELYDGARSLVPPGSFIVEEVEGDCIELAPSPSCVHIYLIPEEVSLEARTRAVEEAAQASGWRRTRAESLPGGNELRYRRGQLAAIVVLRADEVSAACRDERQRECADAVMVEKAS